jgi:hypothetical protein
MDTTNKTQEKKALAKARKMNFDRELKSVTEKERAFTKAYLAQKLHEDCNFDLPLCNQTLDALCAELFPEVPPPPAMPHAKEEPAAGPVHNPRRRTLTSILLVIIAALLALFAAALWYKIGRQKAEIPPYQNEGTRIRLPGIFVG